MKRILPSHATDKLRKLELNVPVPTSSPSDALKEFGLLRRFENLKSLSFGRFTPALGRALSDSTLRLTTFRTSIAGPFRTHNALHTESLIDFLESPVLHDVEIFHCSIDYEPAYERFI
jgi:hypothetical protein